MRLETYQISSESDFNKVHTKQQVIHRLESWLEGYTDAFIRSYGQSNPYPFRDLVDVAIDSAKFELLDFKCFEKINEDSELIDVDPLDQPEQYKYQMEIINQWAEKL